MGYGMRMNLPGAARLRLPSGRIRLRQGGTPRLRKVRLSRPEMIQALIFLLIMIVFFALAMYVGWWTLQQEEHQAEQEQHTRG